MGGVAVPLPEAGLESSKRLLTPGLGPKNENFSYSEKFKEEK